MKSCCLRTNRKKQISSPFHPIQLNDNNDSLASPFLTMTLDHFNLFLESNLDWKHNHVGPSGHPIPPVSLKLSHDAGLLNCQKPLLGREEATMKFTILGIHEHQSLYCKDIDIDMNSGSDGDGEDEYESKKDHELKVIIEAHRTSPFPVNDCEGEGCQCNHPHFDWTRKTSSTSTGNATGTTTVTTVKSSTEPKFVTNADARIKIIDLTQVQSERRRNSNPDSEEYVCLNSPASICHLLRSVLHCGDGRNDINADADTTTDADADADTDNTTSTTYGVHCASPWRECCIPANHHSPTTTTTTTTNNSNPGNPKQSVECDEVDQVIGILLRNQIDNDSTAYSKSRPMNNASFWDELEEGELREFHKFRTSDAVPSYYLHSLSGLKGTFHLDPFVEKNKHENANANANQGNDDAEVAKNGYTLLVYRHLPPRPQFKSTLISEEGDRDGNTQLLKGCLWETVNVKASSSTTTTTNTNADNNEDTPSINNAAEENASPTVTVQRMVAPPYQDIHDIFGDAIDILTLDENIKILAEEARRIPQWTAWPEKTHYQSEYDDSDHIDSAYPASWTVFPLCHTFPASDVSKRKFIPLTTGFVPKTTELLQSLGPVLRTALFSRLEPRTTLGAHTGWSDLANHVLRVHIPLSVPADHGHDGLCGTWVDGCVETHRNGRIISFDDSKTHRAFNYSDEDRIVLILDLARPDEGFPMGTSTGGHTDELDKFINQFAG